MKRQIKVVSHAAKIAALRATHGVVAHAAKRVGVHRVTFARWIAADDELRAELEQARAAVCDLAEGSLRQLLEDRDHPQHAEAVFFTLRTLGRSRGYGAPIEARPATGERATVIFFAPASAPNAQEATD